MKTRAAITLGLSVLVLGGTAVGVQAGIAVASSREQSHAEKLAMAEAAVAQKALAKGRPAVAIQHAEAAVAAQPQAVSYRLLLGQSYLKAGRFTSARTAFGDALMLDGTSGKAALNLALMQIGTGDWAGARTTLDAHADIIPAADRGLAVALAGDPTAAVEMLTAAARTPEADAKTRQNLALALALAGRWQDARSVVELDVAPADVDARIGAWATFARPVSASDQVASLLGVTPVVDAGQPVALALNGVTSATALAATTPTPDKPVDAYMPGQQAAAEPATPAPVAVAETAVAAPASETPVVASASGVVFGPRLEVVQPLPVRAASVVAKSTSVPVVTRTAVAKRVAAPVAPRAIAKGSFYVQLGAYQNAGVAKDAWSRAARRFAGFAPHTPQGMSVTKKVGNFYRLSLGGFARADAVSLCNGYKAKGGTCFVRTGAGDQVAMWAKGGREMASR